MKKIPTLFRRNPDDMRYVLPEVHPDCQWVLDGEGVATRKYDGTCVMFDGRRWWARREVKPGKRTPQGFREIETDVMTGKTVGWEPIEQSGFAKWHAEAFDSEWTGLTDWLPGTYELIGPKINGNPERADDHWLIRHEDAERVYPLGLTYEELRTTLLLLADDHNVEGIVWHHPDGRMAKLKARDFPSARHTEGTDQT